jgi:large subunit ribosomal protein L15
MNMKLHTIRDNLGARQSPKVVGRGIGSGLGKTCGRGGKGQTARSGVALNGFEGGQNPIYRRLPKRGFVNIHREELFELTLEKINLLLNSGRVQPQSVIDFSFLQTLKLVRTRHKGISVFGNDDLGQAVSVVVDRISKKAREIIEKSGGQVTLLARSSEHSKPKSE